MLCYLFPKPVYFLFSSDVPALLYYTYIPTTVVALLIGLYVLWNNKHLLLNRLLFIISVLFSFWTLSILIEWTNVRSDFILFIWNFQGVIFGLIAIFCVYFIYVFLNQRDVSTQVKLVFLALLAPLVIATPTLYLKGFNITECDAFEFSWQLVEIYYILLGVAAMIWILVLLIRKYRVAEVNFKRQIMLMGIGIEVFLFLFFLWTNLIYHLTNIGVLSDSRLEMYGMLGMVIFIGFLAYLIVEYRVFNVKLLGAQALVAAIIILIASQFFFIRSTTNKILTTFTLAIVLVFGWWLVKAVKKEDEQNEKLEIANKKIEADKEIVERANQELIRLDKAKTEFINVASHQLKTPISVIQGVASMLLEGDIDKLPPAKKQRFYRAVWEKSQKLKIIIHDILNATNLSDQKYNIMDKSAEMIDIPEFLQQIIDDFEGEVKERDIDLTFSFEKNLARVRGQKEYLQEAFINLINNAIKYTPSSVMTPDVRGKRSGKERGKVDISVGRDPDNSKNIMVKVKDNGIGIPEESKAKLFQRFSRAENAVNMYTDGTGLGLFVVREVVEGHQGKVWFESELNKGTTFFVSLPFAPTGTVDVKKHIAQSAAEDTGN